MRDADDVNVQMPPAVLDYASPEIDRRLRNPMAWASVVCALLFIPLLVVHLSNRSDEFITAVLWLVASVDAVIFGVGGLLASARHNSSGRRRAMVGVVLGILGLTACGIIFFRPFVCSYPTGRPYRVQCASNLRQIGQGIFLFANDNAGKFPSQLGQLITGADINPEVLVCPDSNDMKATGANTQQILADFAKPGHCSYVYLGAGLTSKTVLADTVVAYENLADHGGDGMNVLFGDGHVDWFNKNGATYLLKELQAGINPPRPEPPSGK